MDDDDDEAGAAAAAFPFPITFGNIILPSFVARRLEPFGAAVSTELPTDFAAAVAAPGVLEAAVVTAVEVRGGDAGVFGKGADVADPLVDDVDVEPLVFGGASSFGVGDALRCAGCDDIDGPPRGAGAVDRTAGRAPALGWILAMAIKLDD